MRLAVVMPALNEAAGVTRAVSEVLAQADALSQMGVAVEVVVVDNGSADRTGHLARNAGATVLFQPRRGYGAAIKHGVLHARADIIVVMDADCTYPANFLPVLVGQMERHALGFLSTQRVPVDSAMSASSMAGNGFFRLVSRLLFLTLPADTQSGMWAFKAPLRWCQRGLGDGMEYSQQAKHRLCRAADRWGEAQVPYHPREGSSKLRPVRDGLRVLWHLVGLRFA